MSEFGESVKLISTPKGLNCIFSDDLKQFTTRFPFLTLGLVVRSFFILEFAWLL